MIMYQYVKQTSDAPSIITYKYYNSLTRYKHPRTNLKHTEMNYRSYKSFNAEAFQQDLQQVLWSILDNIEDPNQNWMTWKSFFFAILDKHAPQRIWRIRTDSAPWINDTILTAMQEREQACRFNTKDLWKTLKLLLPSKRKSGAQSFVVNGVFETDPKVVATAFNNCFVKIGVIFAEAFEDSSEGFMFKGKCGTN